MTLQEITQQMTEIFRDVLDDPAIVLARATTAADIEDWDSLAQISLLVAIEREFKIQITLAESKSLANVGEMIDLVAGKTG